MELLLSKRLQRQLLFMRILPFVGGFPTVFAMLRDAASCLICYYCMRIAVFCHSLLRLSQTIFFQKGFFVPETERDAPAA